MSDFIKFLKKFEDKLAHLEEIIVATLLFAMTLAIFFAVIERFFIQTGVTWVEEFARYLSVWAAFIGSSLAVYKCAHIGIEAFVQMLPEKVRKIESLAVDAIGAAFGIIVFCVGMSFLVTIKATNQLSPALRINMVWAYAAVPVGCGLMAVHYIIRLAIGLAGNCNEEKSECAS